jgi:hypothetical protein
MRLLTKRQVPIETYRAGSSLLGAVLPWVAIAYGVTMPIGGNDRWKDHSLEILMFFPGAATVYGTVLLVLGLLMGIGLITDVPAMLWAGGWGCGFWFVVAGVATTGQAIADHDTVYVAGAVVWAFLAVNCIVYATARVNREPKPVEHRPGDQKK